VTKPSATIKEAAAEGLRACRGPLRLNAF